MDLRVIVLLITTGANLALAVAILFKNWRNKINVFFSLMLFSITLWSYFLAMFYVASDLQSAQQTTMPIYISAALIAIFFYYFSRYFPFELQKMTLLDHIISFFSLLMVIFVIAVVRVEATISYDSITRNQETIINPLGYFIFVIYFCYYIISGFYTLFNKLKSAAAIHRKQIQIVVFSTLFAAVLGTLFNLAILGITYSYDWLGPFFTVIMVFVIARFVFFENK